MNRKLRTRHRWLILVVALVAGTVAVLAIAFREAPALDDGPVLGARTVKVHHA